MDGTPLNLGRKNLSERRALRFLIGSFLALAVEEKLRVYLGHVRAGFQYGGDAAEPQPS
jgi:hypothetical protein